MTRECADAVREPMEQAIARRTALFTIPNASRVIAQLGAVFADRAPRRIAPQKAIMQALVSLVR